MFNTSVVFKANFESKADIVINQGGTDSGKTHSIIQVLFVIACSSEPTPDNPVITILSESVPNSKKGAYRIAESIYKENSYVQSQVVSWNIGERVLKFKSGWIMEFVGATDEQNAKQGKRQYLFANECNGISWPIFWQFAKRTRIRTFIDYNPSAPFWAHEKLIGTQPEGNDLNARVQLIISDHRHNPFLTEADHRKTESIKDPELWRVYARGLTGNLSGLIYPNWKQIDVKDFPFDSENIFGGIDFGYTNDPTAGVVCARVGGSVFVHEVCYDHEVTDIQIAQLYKALKFREGETPLYCEHDRDRIRAIRLQGILSIPAQKGAGSIKAGIAKVNEFDIFYTSSSKNITFERAKYLWLKDKDTGKFVNVASENDNHLMDAIRYAIHTHTYRQLI